MNPSPESIRRTRTIFLTVGVICLLLLGLIYGFSMFAKPMMQDFGIASVGNTFYIMMICFCLGMLIGARMLAKLGIRPTLIFAAIMFGLGFCLTGLFAAQGGMTVLYACYAIVGGLGVGIGYNTILAIVNLWFPDRIGLSSGLLLMFFGLSSLVCGNAALALRGALGSIAPVFICIGIVGAVLTLMFAFVLKRPPAEIAEIMMPAKAAAAAEAAAEAAEKPEKPAAVDKSVRFENDNVWKTPIFYTYYAVNIIMVMMGLGVIGSIAADGTSLGLAESFAALLVGLVAATNGGGRLVMGIVLDRLDVPKTFLIDIAIAAIGMALIFTAYKTGMSALYVVGAFCGGFSYGGCPVVGSAFARKRFGAKKYASNLAFVNCTVAFGALFNIIVTAVLGADARLAFFLVILVLIIVSFVLALLFNRQWKSAFADEDAELAEPIVPAE